MANTISPNSRTDIPQNNSDFHVVINPYNIQHVNEPLNVVHQNSHNETNFVWNE